VTATLSELAARFGCEFRGAGDTPVVRVGTLTGAGSDAISFLANALYRDKLGQTRAAIVILEPRYLDECPVPALLSSNPYATYARIAAYLHPPSAIEPGIHPSASVADGVQVPASSQIAAQTVLGRGVQIGENVLIGAGSVLGRDVAIGDGTRVSARVTLLDGVKIGRRCIISSGAIIGADGFGFAYDDGAWTKVPQLGAVIVGDDVEIGANTTVDRGTIENTIIEDGVKIDNLVQIAHNVRVGAHTVMAAMSGVAGSTKIGRRCRIGGGVVMVNQIEIADDTMFTFRSVVTKSVTAAGVYGGSLAAEEATKWRRNAARFKSLDALAERLRAVEKKLRRLDTEQADKEEGND
jgi:UDP-3-O-[3-hydroxymyristoyl] glucosamine N-acyltransferase